MWERQRPTLPLSMFLPHRHTFIKSAVSTLSGPPTHHNTEVRQVINTSLPGSSIERGGSFLSSLPDKTSHTRFLFAELNKKQGPSNSSPSSNAIVIQNIISHSNCYNGYTAIIWEIALDRLIPFVINECHKVYLQRFADASVVSHRTTK